MTFVPLVGFRVREPEMLAFGMSLPGLDNRAAAIGQLPALGVLTLAGMMSDGWTCSYLPLETVDQDSVERVLKERPDLVAISALTASVLEAYRLSEELRRAGVTTVIGGLHATVLPSEAAASCSSVVVGPGEYVWLDVLTDSRCGALKPIYDARSKSRPNFWPRPRFDLLPSDCQRFTLQTQRGCPLACDFCAASRLLGPFIEKPVDCVADELLAIQHLTPHPLLELADDNTFAGSRKPQVLFDLLERCGARYFTEADWRIGERPELLRGLARSGCVQVLMGIESLVFRFPGMGQKQAEWERIMAAVDRIQDAGVAVNGCFIVGADGECRASLDRLVEFILDSPLADVQMTLQTPFPGTGLRRRLSESGRLLSNRNWSHYTLFDVTFQPDRLTVAELEAGFRAALTEVFGCAATARRNAIRKEVWSHRPRSVRSPASAVRS